MSHSDTSDLTDIQWERLQPLLGLMRTGCQWDELPKEYPNHNSV